MNEIAQARTSLLNPAKRKEYDALLAKKAAANKKIAGVGTDSSSSSPMPAHSTPFADLDDDGFVPKRTDDKQPRTPDAAIAKEGVFLTKPKLYGLIGGGVGLVLIIVVALVLAFGGSKRVADPPLK